MTAKNPREMTGDEFRQPLACATSDLIAPHLLAKWPPHLRGKVVAALAEMERLTAPPPPEAP